MRLVHEGYRVLCKGTNG